MTQEEKQLLVKDLCARIPYRTFVSLNPGAYNKPETCALTGVHGEQIHLDVDTDPFGINNIRPYLRSLSSMTMEEKREYISIGRSMSPDNPSALVDWFNANHFNYRLPPHLFVEAPEGMYKTE